MPESNKEHELDTLLVRNIDVGCEDKSTDIIKATQREQDPETGAWLTKYAEISDEFHHSEFFQVKWGGKPIRVAPGQTRKMPRFLAEHYAKHLADHILAKREKEENREGLINHVVERPKVMGEIILGVDGFYEDFGLVDEGTQALNQFEEMNRSPVAAEMGMGGGSMDLGELDAGTVSRDHFKLQDDVKSMDEVLETASQQPEEKPNDNEGKFAAVSRQDLFREVRAIDPTYKFSGRENRTQLIAIIQKNT